MELRVYGEPDAGSVEQIERCAAAGDALAAALMADHHLGYSQPIAALRSTVHGAGRVMSRTKAAGKTRMRWSCTNRDCDWFVPVGETKPDDGKCPVCGTHGMRKQLQQITKGEVDWDQTKRDVAGLGIELRGAGADEAPAAYKRLPEVLSAHGDSVRVKHRLRPIGVAMAGPDIFDPYKD